VHQGIKLTPRRGEGESGGGSFGASVRDEPRRQHRRGPPGSAGGWMFTAFGRKRGTQQGGKFTPTEGPEPISSLAVSSDGTTGGGWDPPRTTPSHGRGVGVHALRAKPGRSRAESSPAQARSEIAEFGKERGAVSADGSTAVIGARARPTPNDGSAYVFHARQAKAWTQQGCKNHADRGRWGEGHFGEGVALSARTANTAPDRRRQRQQTRRGVGVHAQW